MKKTLLLLLLGCAVLATHAQLKNPLKKEKGESQPKEKKAKLNLSERMGVMTGKLMTKKTTELDGAVANVSYICGFYPPEIRTTETKFMPDYVKEGDYLIGVNFMKGDGIGMYNVQGKIYAGDREIPYIELGAYGGRLYPPPVDEVVTLKIETESGDQAVFKIAPVPPIELLEVNGETSMPIMDMNEDFTIKFTNPPGSDGTRVRVSLITDALGVRALNHFADLEAGADPVRTVTIPKESLANPEIVGGLDIGNYTQGNNYLIVEREYKSGKTEYLEGSDPGDLEASDISARSYSSMPVIVKGKQEGGLLASIQVGGRSEDETVGYSITKPNAQTGIPFSEAKRFGVVSFTLDAQTFREETETSSSSWTVGNTRYTQTTITTTTYEFPQLPDSHWDYVMESIYQDITAFFESEYGIEFVPVEDVIGTADYKELFYQPQSNTKSTVQKSYKGTQRSTPKNVSEMWSQRSTNMTADNPQVRMMKEAGEVDGLMSIHINLSVGANKGNKIVLVPTLSVSVQGRDETNNDKLGQYFNAVISRNTGEEFNGDQVRASQDELLRVISYPVMQQALKSGITQMRAKEVELGFDKIWTIGEE